MKYPVAVAIMSYRYGRFLANCLDSVMCQTFQPSQVFVVDDAAFDESGEVARDYGVDFIQREKNLGIRENFQRVLMDTFDQELCFYLGADNWLHPTYIEEVYNRLREGDYSWVSTHIYIVGEFANDAQDIMKKREVYPTYTDSGYIVWGSHWTGSSLFRLDHGRASGGFYGRVQHTPDTDMWRHMESLGYTWSCVEKPLLYCRRHRFNFNTDHMKRYRDSVEWG